MTTDPIITGTTQVPTPPPSPVPMPTVAPWLANVQATESFIDRVISRNAKAWAAALVSAITWGYTVVNSAAPGITAHEWLDLAKGAAVALGVYGATNTPSPPKP